MLDSSAKLCSPYFSARKTRGDPVTAAYITGARKVIQSLNNECSNCSFSNLSNGRLH